jgi:hypothetical protein
MKTTLLQPLHATRTAAFLMVALGLGFSAALADDSVVVKLGNKSFGFDSNLHANGKKSLATATSYSFHAAGTCHTTGDLAGLIGEGTSIPEIFGKALKGKFSHDGSPPPFVVFDRRLNVTRSILNPFPVSVTLSARVKGGVRADGTPYLDITGLTLDPSLPISGTIAFEPGAKLIVSVAP